MTDADYMLSASFQENASHELRVASSDHHKLQFTLCREDQISKVLATNQLTVTFVGLEQQEVSLIFVQVVIAANCFECVKDTVAREMKTKGFLCEDLLKAIRCTLSLSNAELSAS